MKLFIKHETRVEGWFKGEMMWLLDDAKKELGLDAYNVECHAGGKRFDFCIKKSQERILLELKALAVTMGRSLSFYYSRQQGFLGDEILKLHKVREKVYKYQLVIAYPCDKEKWETHMRRVESRYPMAKCVKYGTFEADGGDCLISLWRIE